MIPLPVVDALDSITIPVPCPVSWDAMHGDHRTRFCDECSQNVHDVSELTRDEAVQLVTGSEQLPCLRLFRRPDGRVMTADCMTKRERAWKWLHRRSAWAAAIFAFVFMGCSPVVAPGEPCMGSPPPPSAEEITVQEFILEHSERTTPTNHTPPAGQTEAAACRNVRSTRERSGAVDMNPGRWPGLRKHGPSGR